VEVNCLLDQMDSKFSTGVTMNPNALSAQQLRQAADLKEKIDTLQKRLDELLGDEVPTPVQAKNGKRRMSATAKANIRAAQKARWAKIKGTAKPAKKPKRKMSAAGRAAVSAAAKARWAKAKKAGKSKL
jgi:hypothetical protein